MEDFVNQWNSHSIRPTRYSACPGGIPDDLYDMPEQYGMIQSSSSNADTLGTRLISEVSFSC